MDNISWRTRFRTLFDRLADAAALPADDRETRTRKASLIVLALVIVPLTPVWVVTYWVLGLGLAGSIPLAYGLISIALLGHFVRTKRFAAFRDSQLVLMLVLPFALQWSLGGFVASSAIAVWGFASPMGALAFRGPRQAAPWFAAYLGLVVFSAVIDPALTSHAGEIPEPIRLGFFAANIIGVSLVTYLVLQYLMRALDRERAKSERLLRNVLPERIAERLKEADGVISERFAEVTVLFADIVGFTAFAESVSPERVVEVLDELFTSFDRLAEKRGLEKIKTIGDAYMVAGGLPEPRPDHAEAVADMGLAMREEVERFAANSTDLSVRIGIDSGPVVAGVIGRRKFIYDLWGDTVNTASRMESHGIPGCIQVTERVHERLKDAYLFEPRGLIEVKGKRKVAAYFLVGRGAHEEG